MKRGVAAATIGGLTPAPEKTTVEQARAIMCTAWRAVEAAEAKRGDDDDGGAAPGLSMKKSIQWFLECRKNRQAMAAAATGAGIHRQLEDDDSTSSSKY